MLDVDPFENLFVRVPKLPLPAPMQKFLLFNMSVSGDENSDEESDVTGESLEWSDVTGESSE